MRIAVGSDRAGQQLRRQVIDHLKELGHTVTDHGTDSPDTSDYPDYAEKVARQVACGDADFGILTCGSGLGVAIAANKVNGVRAVTCHEPYSAEMTRAHNDTNVLCMGQEFIGRNMALKVTDAFLGGAFEGGRHQRRVDKITALEGKR